MRLFRLDRIIQTPRANLKIWYVLGPLVFFLVATLAILLLWTIIDPWTWRRTMVSEIPPETYGECHSDHWWAFFGTLTGLMIFAETLTGFLAYKTNQVPEEFRETSSVFQAIYVHLQAWIIGVPILAVIGTSSADATYFGRVALIWIFSVSSVVLIVGPKLMMAIRIRRNPGLDQRNEVRSIFKKSTPGNVSGASLLSGTSNRFKGGISETSMHSDNYDVTEQSAS